LLAAGVERWKIVCDEWEAGQPAVACVVAAVAVVMARLVAAAAVVAAIVASYCSKEQRPRQHLQ